MHDINNAINSIYYSIINEINFDVSNKTISFDLTLIDNEKTSHHTMQFTNVTSFLWVEKTRNDEYYNYSDCEYYELTAVVLNKTVATSNDAWLKQYPTEYNIAIEIWKSALLINATEVSIDNQLFQISN